MNRNLERLQKIIAQSGITSRRKAEQYIVDARVKVKQETVTELATKVTEKDEGAVDDAPIHREQRIYYVLYRPRWIISAVTDDKNRKTGVDLMEDVTERVFPIGRLDYNSSGILLLTNDGDFANLLMHPRYEIKKEYVVKVKGISSKQDLEQSKKGIKQ